MATVTRIVDDQFEIEYMTTENDFHYTENHEYIYIEAVLDLLRDAGYKIIEPEEID